MRRVIPLICALLLGAAVPERVEVTAENVGTFYQAFSRLTPQPREVSALLTSLCTHPTEQQWAKERWRVGEHASTRVHLYAHGVELEVFRQNERSFPVGTVVVKEKLAADLTASAVGGMVKMEAGFDPAGGDWKYFFGSKGGEFSSGRLENCRSCHLRARESDFVFFIAPNQP